MTPFPFRAGCVDAGSNAIRLVMGEFRSPLQWEAFHYERVPIRMGTGVFKDGRIDPQVMDDCVSAFGGFAEQARAFEVQSFRAVATSAVRESRDGPLLCERIHRETGIELDVISGKEEAYLVHRAIRERLDLAGEEWVLVDLGGGSVELSLVDQAGLIQTESYPWGSLRLLETLSKSGNGKGDARRGLVGVIDGLKMPTAMPRSKSAGIIATGGNIDVLAEFAAAPRDNGGVRRLQSDALDAAIELLARFTPAERVQQFVMGEDRADVIVPAALVYQRLAKLAVASEILVPGVGVKDGVILGLLDDHRSGRTPA